MTQERHKGDTCLRATPHHKHYVSLRWGPQNRKTNAQEEDLWWCCERFLLKYLQMSDIFRTFAASKVIRTTKIKKYVSNTDQRKSHFADDGQLRKRSVLHSRGVYG